MSRDPPLSRRRRRVNWRTEFGAAPRVIDPSHEADVRDSSFQGLGQVPGGVGGKCPVNIRTGGDR